MQKDFITVTPDSGNGNATISINSEFNTARYDKTQLYQSQLQKIINFPRLFRFPYKKGLAIQLEIGQE